MEDDFISLYLYPYKYFISYFNTDREKQLKSNIVVLTRWKTAFF